MKKLLVVEDNKGFLEMFTNLLNVHLADLKIFKAENGSEAVNLLENTQVDLIVTDLQMPVMDGFALAEFCNHQYPHIPGIGMSGDLTPAVETALATLGVRQYLAKPFDIRQRVQAIVVELGDGARQIAVA